MTPSGDCQVIGCTISSGNSGENQLSDIKKILSQYDENRILRKCIGKVMILNMLHMINSKIHIICHICNFKSIVLYNSSNMITQI